MAYQVTAGSATAETNVGPGRARVDFPRGATLPADVPAEDVHRLLTLGHVVEVPDFNEPPEPDDPGLDAVPDATVAVVLQWVAIDPAPPGRALRARAFEHGKADKARSTLVAELDAIIQQHDTPDE